jgi:hypothetical protein
MKPTDVGQVTRNKMADIATRPLFTMRMSVESQPLGTTRGAEQRVLNIKDCTIDGDRVKGRVLPGGSDWVTVSQDGAVWLNCRMVVETDDGALIGLSYRGMRNGPPEEMTRQQRGEPVDASRFYHRVAIFFDTSAERYRWLTRILAVGKGNRQPDGSGIYEVYEVL